MDKKFLNTLADKMSQESSNLKKHDLLHPLQGEKYYLNLRANILQDFAVVIRKTIFEAEDSGIKKTNK